MNWFIGLITGIGLCMWLDWYTPHTQEAIKARELIKECEATLPRNESCELVARPIAKAFTPKATVEKVLVDCSVPNPLSQVDLEKLTGVPIHCAKDYKANCPDNTVLSSDGQSLTMENVLQLNRMGAELKCTPVLE